MSRRAARVAAVEVLYAAEIRGIDPEVVLSERVDADEYSARLVRGAVERLTELDALLGRHSVGWRLERMSPVDKNVLRVGVLELLLGEVPPAAAIDEAIDIAKRFSGEDAGRFVNGVLDAVLQDSRGGGGGGVDGGDPGAGGGGGGGGAGRGGGGGAGGGGGGPGGASEGEAGSEGSRGASSA